jgi:DDE superfamily endonuclease
MEGNHMHCHVEWLKFLRQIHRQTPNDKTLHLIADNYATHKHPTGQAWLDKHRRFHMHFTPTSASRLHMVERFFRDITTERLRRGLFTSVPQFSLPLTNTSPTATPIPSRSSGPRARVTSCRRSSGQTTA